jgi:hypothetical protein
MLLLDTSNLDQDIMHLQSLYEKHHDASMDIEENKQCVKFQYDKTICPWQYVEGDLVLLYDQAKEPLGEEKFKTMWHGPYIMRHVLEKGAY